MSDIIKAGPLVKLDGMLPLRVVLRAKTDDAGNVREYVIHQQGFLSPTQPSFCHGSYIPVRNDPEQARERAEKVFQERCDNRYPRPTLDNIRDLYQHPELLEVIQELHKDDHVEV